MLPANTIDAKARGQAPECGAQCHDGENCVSAPPTEFEDEVEEVPAVVKSVKKVSVPKLAFDEDTNKLEIQISTEDELLELIGTRTIDAGQAILLSGINALGVMGAPYRELAISMLVEMEPKDAVEAMLIGQMTTTHVAIADCSSKFLDVGSVELREKYNIMLTRLNRTFCTQVETLKKYRAKATQTVRVERVVVEEGGQAVVGEVNHGRG